MKLKNLLFLSLSSLSLPTIILTGMTSCSNEDKDIIKVDKITSFMYQQLLYSDPLTLVENGKLKLQWNHSKFDQWPDQSSQKIFYGFFTPAEKFTEESITTFSYSSCSLTIANQPAPLSYKNPEDFEKEILNNTFTIKIMEDIFTTSKEDIMCLLFRCDTAEQATNISLNINLTTPPSVKLVFTTFSPSSNTSNIKEEK